jgi:hypothetical protein
MFRSIKSLLGRILAAPARQPSRRRARPALERLESREVPTVAVGPHGETFATFYNDNQLFVRGSSGWQSMQINGVQSVSAGANGTVDVTTQDGSIRQWAATTGWQTLWHSVGTNPGATAVAAGPHGEVYGAFGSDREVWELPGSGTSWQSLGASGAVSLSVGATGKMVGLFSDGTIWQSLGGTSWAPVWKNGSPSAVAVGPDGGVYAAFFDDRHLWELDPQGNWHDLQQTGVMSLGAGANGALDEVLKDGSLKQFSGGTWQTQATIANTDRGLAAIQFGLSNLNQSVVVPGFAPTCANFVIEALAAAGAMSTVDFGVVDPPGQPSGQVSAVDYVWGNLKLTYHPAGSSTVSALTNVQPGDVLQFRDVNQPAGILPIQQHTAIVYANLGGGKFLVLQQNFAGHAFVTLDVMDLSTMSGGTVWVYQPVPK